MKSTMMPMWDFAILEQDMLKKIVRPDSADPRKIGQLELSIIAIGPDCIHFKIGDRLIFNVTTAPMFAFEGRQYFVVSERTTFVIVATERVITKSRPDVKPA